MHRAPTYIAKGNASKLVSLPPFSTTSSLGRVPTCLPPPGPVSEPPCSRPSGKPCHMGSPATRRHQENLEAPLETAPALGDCWPGHPNSHPLTVPSSSLHPTRVLVQNHSWAPSQGGLGFITPRPDAMELLAKDLAGRQNRLGSSPVLASYIPQNAHCLEPVSPQWSGFSRAPIPMVQRR